ncbi:hypothetical protein HanIR_Chr09g0450341 [Helianthus annuus]|nr:hypothetical protein HanIR_Chr09g0450341 [Helianthus annuus]
MNFHSCKPLHLWCGRLRCTGAEPSMALMCGMERFCVGEPKSFFNGCESWMWKVESHPPYVIILRE